MWTYDETRYLLNLIEEYNYIHQIRNDDRLVYKKLAKLLNVSGFSKTHEEIQEHRQHLLSEWQNAKSEDRSKSEYFSEMDSLIQEKCSKTDIGIGARTNNYCENKVLSESDSNKKRAIWSQKETEHIIEVLKKYGLPNRKNKSKIVRIILDYLKQLGYRRSEIQVQIKIKNLRACYYQVLHGHIKESDFPFFKEVQELLEHQKEKDEMWTNEELQTLLDFIEQADIRSTKELGKFVNKATDYLSEHNFTRTPTMILSFWQNCRSLYLSVREKNVEDPEKECPFFYRFRSILNGFHEECGNDTISDEEIDNLTFSEQKMDQHESKITSIKGDNCSSNKESNSVALSNNLVSFESKTSSDMLNIMNSNKLNDLDHYCICLSKKIKSLDPKRQSKLKIEIDKLLYKAEFDINF